VRQPLVGLLVAEAISLLGTRMSMVALPWFVLVTTGSVVRTGVVAFAELLPYVIAQGAGGPWVDRLGARRTAVAADAAAAVFIGLVPLLHTLGVLDLGLLALLAGATGGSRGAADSAKRVLLPGVAELADASIERTTGLYDGVNRLASLLGAPAAGLLLAAAGAPTVLAIDAVTFGLSAAIVVATVPRRVGPRQPAPRESYLSSLREGFTFLRADRLLLGIAFMVLVTNLLDAAYFSVLLPAWVEEVLGNPSRSA
jgi:MFS family permease